MQPSCFVTDGKEELMQTSKNHFEAKVIFNDETIRRMFRTEFYTYEGMQRLVWLAVAFALVMLASQRWSRCSACWWGARCSPCRIF